MIIRIITEREIIDDEYWLWAGSALEAINSINQQEFGDDRLDISFFQKLLDDGVASFEDDIGYTKAKTTYKIISRR